MNPQLPLNYFQQALTFLLTTRCEGFLEPVISSQAVKSKQTSEQNPEVKTRTGPAGSRPTSPNQQFICLKQNFIHLTK